MDEHPCTADCGGVSPSKLHVEEQWNEAFVVKKEPEEILSTPIGESALPEDYGGVSPSPLYMEKEMGYAYAVKEEPDEFATLRIDEGPYSDALDSVSSLQMQLEGDDKDGPPRIKKEPDDASAVSVGDGSDCEEAHSLSASHVPVNELERATTTVKEESDEFVTLRIDDGWCSEALESVLSLQVHLEGHWRDGPLRVIEVPDEILPTSTGHCSRTEDIGRMSTCQQHLGDHLNSSCVANQELDNVKGKSSDPGVSSSLSSFEGRLDKRCQDQGEKTVHLCRFCPYSGRHSTAVTYHERTHTGDRPFSCNVCKKVFMTRNILEIHARTHTDSRPFKCTTCPKDFRWKSSLKIHERGHTNEKPYECSTCGKRFVSKSSLICHQARHSDARPYKCPTCHKEFRLKSSLDSHNIMHMGGRPYKCNACCEAFTKKDHLVLHQVTHTGKEPFKCSACPRIFRWRSQLDLHKSIHTSEKPYKCETCGKEFKWKFNFTSHQAKHTGAKRFKCLICSKEFHWRSSLSIHKKVHELENPYRCNTCSQPFRSQSALTRHEWFHKDIRPLFKYPNYPSTFQLKSGLNNNELMPKDYPQSLYKCSTSEGVCRDDRPSKSHPAIHTEKIATQWSTFNRKDCKDVHDGIPISEMAHMSKACDVAVAEVRHLNANQAVCTREELSNCPAETSVFQLKLPFQLRLPSNVSSLVYKGKIYKCSTCAMAFTDEHLLKTHQAVHRNESRCDSPPV